MLHRNLNIINKIKQDKTMEFPTQMHHQSQQFKNGHTQLNQEIADIVKTAAMRKACMQIIQQRELKGSALNLPVPSPT